MSREQPLVRALLELADDGGGLQGAGGLLPGAHQGSSAGHLSRTVGTASLMTFAAVPLTVERMATRSGLRSGAGVSCRGEESRDPSAGPSRGHRAFFALMLAALVLVAAATAVMAAVVARPDVADLAGLVIVVVTTPVGVLIARAQPRNPVGWLLLGSALTMAVAEAGAQLI